MTYTILAADRDSGEVGIGITTGSINVGGLAPFSVFMAILRPARPMPDVNSAL